MIPIVPAIIPKTALEVIDILPRLRFSPEIHLDVVDGKFVPFISWPYEPLGSPEEVKPSTDSFTLEVDLMVSEPITAARLWERAGADMLVFHCETITTEEFRQFCTETSLSVSISPSSDTTLETLFKYLPFAHGVQLMGIAKIGAQGQPFDESVLERIVKVKKEFPRLPITIDGSVNSKTIKRIVEAGADRLICGSAIVQAADPYEAHKTLSDLLSGN